MINVFYTIVTDNWPTVKDGIILLTALIYFHLVLYCVIDLIIDTWSWFT